MNISILQGRYNAADAEQLLTAFVKVKTTFHEARIKTVHHEEEDIKHSEKRIKKLNAQLQEIIEQLRSSGNDQVDLHGAISIDLPEIISNSDKAE